MSNSTNSKDTRFLQKTFWVNGEKPKEYMVLVEVDNQSEMPIGTTLVRVPEVETFAFKYHLILN